MIQITVKIDGMACGMCEAHINDAIRRAFPVQKVHSSHKKHTKGQTIIITDQKIDEDRLKTVVSESGYTVLSIEQAPYEKKKFFRK